jgi:AcrR family transcriptional regulator
MNAETAGHRHLETPHLQAEEDGKPEPPDPTVKPPRVTKRRAETRARLIETAYQVFIDKGFGVVSIEDVVVAAGYTRGAFYSQFESLDELFFILYDKWAGRVVEQITGVMKDAEPDDVPITVERVLDTVLLDRGWLLIKTDFLAHAARRPDLAKHWSKHREHLRGAIEEHLTTHGFELNEAFGTTADAARAIIAIYDGVSIQLLLDSDQAFAREWLTQLLRVLLTRSPAVHDLLPG